MLLGGKKKPLSAVMLLYVLLDRTTVHTAAVLFLPNGGQTTGWFCFSGFRREPHEMPIHSTTFDHW